MIKQTISRARGIGYAVVAMAALAIFPCKSAFAAASMESYVSEVDGSQQPYGLYLPEPFDPDVPHPVVFFAHGRGNRANDSFSDTTATPISEREVDTEDH